MGAELLCCRPGEQVQSPGMPWEGQLLEEAEWLGLEAKQAVASSLGLKRRLGLLGEWGLESSFVSNASRLYHALEGPEATYLIVFPKYEVLSPFPFLPVARSWLPVSSRKLRGSTIIFVEKGFPEKSRMAAVADGTENSSGCWGGGEHGLLFPRWQPTSQERMSQNS